MEKAAYSKKRLRKAAIVTAALFVVMLAFSVLQWGIASDFGNIKITRVTFVGEGGAEQSGLMFIPNGVSAQNPAPAIINYHGRNNSSYNMINWAIEEARRGYIVLNPDLAGTLETALNENNTTDNLAVSPVEYLESLDMVSEITVTGHSMANLSLQVIEQRDTEFKPKLKNIVGVGGAFFYSSDGRYGQCPCHDCRAQRPGGYHAGRYAVWGPCRADCLHVFRDRGNEPPGTAV